MQLNGDHTLCMRALDRKAILCAWNATISTTPEVDPKVIEDLQLDQEEDVSQDVEGLGSWDIEDLSLVRTTEIQC